MKIVRNKTTYQVHHKFDDEQEVSLDSTGLHKPIIDLTVKSTWCEIVIGVPEPDFWAQDALKFHMGWSIYDYELYDATISGSVDKLRTSKKIDVDNFKETLFYSSVEAPFPNGMSKIQFRNETDRANLANISTAALCLMAVDPFAELPYRTEDNVTHYVTASGMVNISMFVLNKKQAIVSTAWAHKDALDQITTLSGLEAYDVYLNWPDL